MTIVRGAKSLLKHPLDRIDPALVEEFLRLEDKSKSQTSVLRLLNAYCGLTGVKMHPSTLSTVELNNIAKGFVGAISGDTFLGGPSKSKEQLVRVFIKFFQILLPAFPKDLATSSSRQERIKLCGPTWKKQYKGISPALLSYWSDWELISRKGERRYISLRPVFLSHGQEFAEELHLHLKRYASKRAIFQPVVLNRFLEFISSNPKDYPLSTFTDPVAINNLFKDYMKDQFLDAYRKKTCLSSKTVSWNGFINLVSETFIKPGIWAMPFSGTLPNLPVPKVTGDQRHVKKTKSGLEVKEKMITDVPLVVTDEQAIELLFTTIESDIDVLTMWAEKEVTDIWTRYKKRNELAKNGDHSVTSLGQRSFGPADHANICAIFQKDGYCPEKNYLRRRFGYLTSISSLAELLALPLRHSLHPHQVLLVASHPNITLSFLKNFELYNKYEQRTGFTETDNGYQLVGYKDRRGLSKSEMKIDLTPRNAEIIKQIIALTEPLRDYLRNMGDETWRQLFLTAGGGTSKPTGPQSMNWRGFSPDTTLAKPPNGENIYNAIKDISPYEGRELGHYLSRISLTTLRASCGIRVYLETQSVEDMSEALGHAKYKPELLSHYLPEPILAFLQTRWIRIFQKSIICESMKDSPYLLKAASFTSMSELNLFLKNHAIKDIPEHLVDPENRKSKKVSADSSHLYISVNPVVLTTLVSLKQAVGEKIDQTISPYAKYWSVFSGHVVKEIQQGNDYKLKEMLKAASRNADPKSMEDLIYAAAS